MIIGLGRALNLRIVAEGVETGGQLEALRGMGCDLAQGFLFMRPVPDWCIDELLSGSESPEQQGALIPLQSSPVEATPVGLAPAAVFPGAVPAMLPGSAMPDQLGA
jgi:hypothetical protein